MKDLFEEILGRKPKIGADNNTSDEDIINALERALEATTPEHPGSPWEIKKKKDPSQYNEML